MTRGSLLKEIASGSPISRWSCFLIRAIASRRCLPQDGTPAPVDLGGAA